jgi:uncharacterized protein YggT (Ycf19 family)
MPNASLLTYWSLQLPSLILATLIYLLLGRLILSFAVSAGNPVMRLLTALTDPVLVPVGAITPRVVPPATVIVFAVAWLAAARVALLWVAMARGVRL